ncbi:pyridoxamine 5'-phosphate oxidase family protein [Geomicrobium sp. JCM 19039]|uniref:pyridoxamine 5'-phosphate oxidase family protein n=1 Tax=Geomicrobium sp. JCM 19039 TaxID=1460636 RepID=UPI00045F4D23|nr:pyridoxamine 5'-phosphate oxidase family protein [Geomicrobium sp. JCM 19039]GAK12118.1 general stress protein 26 [Geomicrobium sp. JCM 19039]
MTELTELKERIDQVLTENRIGVLSTIKENHPYARYMTFYHEGLTLYTPTNAHAHKIEDIEENPHVHILMGYEEHEDGNRFVEIEATAEVATDPTDKQKVWSEKIAKKYSGPEDENFVVLICRPTVIRYRSDEIPEAYQELRM